MLTENNRNQNSFTNDLLIALKIGLILFLGFLFIVSKFSVQINWPRDLALIDKGIYLNRFFADFFLYAGLFILLYGKPLILRGLAYLLAMAFVLVFLIQAQSYDVTGSLLISVALENAQHADFLDIDQHVYAAIVWLVFLLIVARLIAVFATQPPRFKSRVLIAFTLMIAAVFVKNDKSWLSEETVKERFEFYNSGRPGFARVSPISELKDTYKDYQEYLEREKWVAQATVQMSEPGARYALENKLPFGALDTEYPLMHKAPELSPLDFLAKPEVDKKLNVVVFFVEGISARAVQPYSDLFPGLWKNVADFSKSATRVDNYYSHAYATYRGLSGQFCSIYAIGRLIAKVNYHCLAHELAAHGYDTRFMVSQRLDSTDLDDLASRAGFQHVDGAEVLAPLLDLPKGKDSKTITDKELMNSLIVRMQEYESRRSEWPFAISLYNFETHTGMWLSQDTTHYSHDGIERSDVLDTFHNFDKAFGKFWAYFKNSPHYDNTVVVVTSDHATFPSREFSRLVSTSTDYAPVFSDKIPLIIYHPDGRSAKSIDAKNASTVNFAPSLLHLLDLQGSVNAFIGKSIFEQDSTFPVVVSSGGATLVSRYDETGQWMKISKNNRDDLPEIFEPAGAYFDYINFTQSLERSNKLIKPQ